MHSFQLPAKRLSANLKTDWRPVLQQTVRKGSKSSRSCRIHPTASVGGIRIGSPAIVTCLLILISVLATIGCEKKIDRDQFRAAQDNGEMPETDSDDNSAAGLRDSSDVNSSETTGDIGATDRNGKSDSDEFSTNTPGVDPKNGDAASETKTEPGSNDKATPDGNQKGKADQQARRDEIYPPAANVPPSTEYDIPAGGMNEVLAVLQVLQKKNKDLHADVFGNREELIDVSRARVHVAARLILIPRLEFDAVNVWLDALNTLVVLEAPEAEQKMEEFISTLERSENPDVADFGKLRSLSQLFEQVAKVDEESEETEQFLKAISRLSAERPDATMIFNAMREASFGLFHQGKRTMGVRTMRAMIVGYADSRTPEIKNALKQIEEHVVLTEARFDVVARDFLDNPDSPDALVKKIMDVLPRPGAGEVTLVEVSRQASVLESYQFSDEALKVYEANKDAFADHADNRLARITADDLARAKIRLSLIGKKLELEGVTLDGTLLDWNEFRNKTIVVLFWSTDSQPSLRLLGELERLSELNAEVGVNLVAVNVDADPRPALREFMKRNPSWTYLCTGDLRETGLETPVARKCGVKSVPYTLIINNEGRVSHTAIVGERLEQALANLLDAEIQGIEKKFQPETGESNQIKEREDKTPDSADATENDKSRDEKKVEESEKKKATPTR